MFTRISEKTEEVTVYVLVVTGMIMGMLRFLVPVSGLHSQDVYKDLAHIFMGGLGMSAFLLKDKILWGMFGLLCAVEVLAVIIRS
jgi:hypothetical protein